MGRPAAGPRSTVPGWRCCQRTRCYGAACQPVVQGRVASVEPFFLEPHGGDLEGFFLVRGEQDELNKIRSEDDFQRLAVRAQVVVQNFGVVGAITGERLNDHMAWFAEAARDVSVAGT